VQIERNIRESKWQGFLNSQPDANIFHTPEMFRVFSKTKGYKPHFWSVLDEDGNIASMMIPVEIVISKKLKSLTTRSVVFGSVLYNHEGDGSQALDYLLKSYLEQDETGSLFTELRNVYDTRPIQEIFSQNNFHFENHLNYLINLDRPIDSVFNSIGKRTRKNIRRGLNKDKVKIREIRDENQLADCLILLRETYRLAKVPLADDSLFISAFQELVPSDMALFLIAYVDDVPVASSIELLFRETIYGWYSGLNRDYASYVPNELLIWYILKWGVEHGYKLYDFGGAGNPNEEYGVRDFKAKFGGELVDFGRNTCIHRPQLLQLSKAGYQIMQTLSGISLT
jgi:lipid II:glycine glycyltransferase (peptidoglycan interpeptide bridge formation enzyme)